MKVNTGGIWIDYKYKNEYQDSSKKGLRLFFSKKVDTENAINIKKFVNFLRKRYYFPLRCNIYIHNVSDFPSLDGDGTTKGFFLFGSEKEKKFPRIYIACQMSVHWSIEDVYYSLARLLTYYFQWYFYENEYRSEKSLEIEATKYAEFLVNAYLDMH